MLDGRVLGASLGNPLYRESPRIARAVHQGGYADVLLRPTMVGLLRCGKMLPPQLLVIEIKFADATTAGAHPAGAMLSTDLEIQHVRVLASQVVLDSALVESFNRVLLLERCLERPERRGEAQRYRGARLYETHGRVCTTTRAPRSTCPTGKDVAPIGAARQKDSLLEYGAQHRHRLPAPQLHCRLSHQAPKMPPSGVTTHLGDLAWFTLRAWTAR